MAEPLPLQSLRVHPSVVVRHDDPYPGYRALRRLGTLFPSGYGAYIACGHAVVGALLRDSRVRVSAPYAGHVEGGGGPSLPSVSMNFSNGADHARRRGFMSRAFQPRVLAGLVPRMEVLLDEVFRGFGRRKTVDIVEDFAQPFPVRVIAEMLGFPRDAHDDCLRWSTIASPIADPILALSRFPAMIEATAQFYDFIRDVMNQRRREPREDIITQLTRRLDSEAELTEVEVISNIISIFMAGHETITAVLAATFVRLHEHPSSRDALDADPALLPSALEEVMRYDPPLQFTNRTTTEDLDIDDVRIPRDTTIWLMIAAANRDHAVFPEPEKFDIRRSPNPHLAFGGGPHACIGAALARLETQHALSRFAARFPRWKMVETDLAPRPTIAIRCWQRVRVALR